MARHFVFTLTEMNIVARARLLEAEAPETCRALWAHLPYEGRCYHAMHSGTMGVLLIDPTITVPTENATTLLQTGDLLFTHYDAGVRRGYLEPLSEIYWAYDRYCTPTAPGQIIPVYPNVFGQFLSGSEDFFAASRRLHLEGAARLVVTGEEGC